MFRPTRRALRSTTLVFPQRQCLPTTCLNITPEEGTVSAIVTAIRDPGLTSPLSMQLRKEVVKGIVSSLHVQ